MAEAGYGAGRGLAETHTVCRCCDIVNSADAVIDGGYDFVHASHDHNPVRTIDEGCDTVAIAINIDQFAILRDGIRTHKIDIAV